MALTIYHPVVLFNGIWLVVFILYKIDYLNFIDIDDRTIAILFLMIIAFPLGAFLGINNRKRITFGSQRKRHYKEFKLNDKIFLILCVITIAVMFIDEAAIIVNLLRGASFHDILRDAGGKGTVAMSGALQVTLYLFVVYPVTYMISPVSAVLFMANNEKKFRYLIVNIIIVALSVAHHGGRNSIYILIISYGIAFLIYNKKTQFKKRTKVFMGLLLILLMAIINMISESRGFDEIGVSFYAYFTCCIPLTQLYVSALSPVTPYLGGFLSFNGYAYPLMAIFNFMGISSPSLYQSTQNVRFFVEDHYLRIGDYSHNMNAFLPAGAYFYMDGGYIFEFVGVLIYGFFVGCAYKNAKMKTNSKSATLYVLLSVGLILSFTRFWFTTYGYAIAIVYILLLFKPIRANAIDEE